MSWEERKTEGGTDDVSSNEGNAMHFPLEPTEHELFPTAQKELLPTYLFCRTKIQFPTCVKTNVLHSFSLPPSKVSRSFGRSVRKLPSALTPSQQVRCSEKGEHFPGSFQYLLPTEVRGSVDNNDVSGEGDEGGEFMHATTCAETRRARGTTPALLHPTFTNGGPSFKGAILT